MTDLVQIPSPGVALEYGEVGKPVVVLVHDWYGRLPWLEPLATAIARHGYHVIVPDLFDGWATIDDVDAENLMNMLDVELALATIEGAVADARAAGSPRASVIGFSMGGSLALLVAQAGGVDAVTAYYATLTPEQHAIVPCPVLLHFAETDEWGEGADPESFVGRLKDDGTPVTSHVYEGTVHSFANATIGAAVHPAAAALAYARTMSFLNGHLIDF